MITNSFASTTTFIVSFLNKIGALPFHIDTVKGHLSVDFTLHCRVFHMWLCHIACVTVILPTNTYSVFQQGQFTELNYMLYIWSCGLCCTIVFGIVALRPRGFCQLLNALYKFIDCLPVQTNPKYSRLVDKGLIALFWTICSVGIFGGIDTIIRPQFPAYFLFGIDERHLSWPLYIINTLLFTSLTVGFGGEVAFIAYNGALYLIYVLPIIKNEMSLGRKSYKTCSSLRSNPEKLVNLWRSLQILVSEANSVLFSGVFLFSQGLFTGIAITSIVTMRYKWSGLELLVKVIMISFVVVFSFGWASILALTGFQYKWSIKTVQSWKRHVWSKRTDRLYVFKICKSCRPLSFGDGKMYVIKQSTVLAFLRSLSKNTLKALVTYGKAFD